MPADESAPSGGAGSDDEQSGDAVIGFLAALSDSDSDSGSGSEHGGRGEPSRAGAAQAIAGEGRLGPAAVAGRLQPSSAIAGSAPSGAGRRRPPPPPDEGLAGEHEAAAGVPTALHGVLARLRVGSSAEQVLAGCAQVVALSAAEEGLEGQRFR